jgi:hypothetical protein
MTIRVATKLALALRTVAALGLVSFGGGATGAADAPIYRCMQANGAVLYADFPCNGGAILDIHPGVADPTASERLQRAQAELDRAAARRRADEQLATQRAELERLRYDAGGPRGIPEPENYPEVVYGLALDGHGRSMHRRPHLPGPSKHLEHRRFESSPSFGARRHEGSNMANRNRPHGSDR